MQAVRSMNDETLDQEEVKGAGTDGMLLRQTSLLSKNEIKLLFKPYTREELQTILMDLFLKQITQLGLDLSAYKTLIQDKAIQLAAGKIDKISGDIRVCFEIVRSAI